MSDLWSARDRQCGCPRREETGFRRPYRGHLEHERVVQLSQSHHSQRRLPGSPADSPTCPVTGPLPQGLHFPASRFSDLSRFPGLLLQTSVQRHPLCRPWIVLPSARYARVTVRSPFAVHVQEKRDAVDASRALLAQKAAKTTASCCISGCPVQQPPR